VDLINNEFDFILTAQEIIERDIWESQCPQNDSYPESYENIRG